jgi:hypothetical protein
MGDTVAVPLALSDGRRRGQTGGRGGRQRGRPARGRLNPGTDFVGRGKPPATDLDMLGGAVLADEVYVG